MGALVFDAPNAAQFVVAINGTPHWARVVRHRTDPSRLLLKSPTPTGAKALARFAGIEADPPARGANFWHVVVNRLAFIEGVKQTMLLVTSPNDAPPTLQ